MAVTEVGRKQIFSMARNTIGETTVHDESGAFKQTLGGIKDEFLDDFEAWLQSTLGGKSTRSINDLSQPGAKRTMTDPNKLHEFSK